MKSHSKKEQAFSLLHVQRWKVFVFVINSSYDFRDNATGALALQGLNDSLIHRMRTRGCIWWRKVECDQFKCPQYSNEQCSY